MTVFSQAKRNAEDAVNRGMTVGSSDAVRIRVHVVGPVAAILLDHDSDYAGAENHEVEHLVKVRAWVETPGRGDIHHLVADLDLPAGGIDARVTEQTREREL